VQVSIKVQNTLLPTEPSFPQRDIPLQVPPEKHRGTETDDGLKTPVKPIAKNIPTSIKRVPIRVPVKISPRSVIKNIKPQKIVAKKIRPQNIVAKGTKPQKIEAKTIKLHINVAKTIKPPENTPITSTKIPSGKISTAVQKPIKVTKIPNVVPKTIKATKESPVKTIKTFSKIPTVVPKPIKVIEKSPINNIRTSAKTPIGTIPTVVSNPIIVSKLIVVSKSIKATKKIPVKIIRTSSKTTKIPTRKIPTVVPKPIKTTKKSPIKILRTSSKTAKTLRKIKGRKKIVGKKPFSVRIKNRISRAVANSELAKSYREVSARIGTAYRTVKGAATMVSSLAFAPIKYGYKAAKYGTKAFVKSLGFVGKVATKAVISGARMLFRGGMGILRGIKEDIEDI
jgi:hypothetical protein